MNNIAVIIPLFNGESWIHATLTSVFQQSYAPSEVVVIDDGSTDQSCEIVQSFSGVRLIKKSELDPEFKKTQNGTEISRNLGTQITTSEFIAFLDQDDIWHSDHLRLLQQMLIDFPEAAAAISEPIVFKNDTDLKFPLPKYQPYQFNPWHYFPRNLLPTPSGVLIRRQALEAIGGWTTQFARGADVYMWLKLSVSAPLVKSDELTFGYRLHSTSTSYQWRLSKNTEYLNGVVSACELTMRDRLNFYPEERQILSQRFAVLQAVEGVLQTCLICEIELLQVQASRLEAELKVLAKTEDFGRRLCEILWWYLQPIIDFSSTKFQYKLIETLQLAWPSNAQYSYRFIPFHPKGHISSLKLFRYLLAHPWRMTWWWLFFKALTWRNLQKLRSRLTGKPIEF